MACLTTIANLSIAPAVQMPSAFELIARIVEMDTRKDAGLAKDA